MFRIVINNERYMATSNYQSFALFSERHRTTMVPAASGLRSIRPRSLQQQHYTARLVRIGDRQSARFRPLLPSLTDFDSRLLCGLHLRVHCRFDWEQFRHCGRSTVAANANGHEFLYRESGRRRHSCHCVLSASHPNEQHLCP